MAARRPFWKWHHWKSIGFCLWPPSTCIWNLKLKFQSKLELCSGNHVVYRQTDGQTDGRTDRRTDKVNPVHPPSNFVGRGYNDNEKRKWTPAISGSWKVKHAFFSLSSSDYINDFPSPLWIRSWHLTHLFLLLQKCIPELGLHWFI